MADTAQSKSVRPFGIRDKFGYMFGDFGNDFMFLFASSFLMVFYTKVMGVPGAIVGILFLVARVIDAFADVTVGIVVDRVNPGKGGKYRSVMMKMAAPAVLFSILMYQSFCLNAAMPVKIVYMFATYIIWGILYSCVNIPYSSMASLVSGEPDDRASLSTYRTVGSTLANLVIGVVTPLVIYVKDASGAQVIRGGEGSQIFGIVAIVFGIAAMACYFLCYKNTIERVKPQDHHNANAEEDRRNVFAMIKSALSSRAMIGLCVGAVCFLLAMMFMNQILMYLFADYFRDSAMLSIANLLGVAVTFIVAPFIKKLTRALGCKGVAMLGSGLAGAAYLTMFVLHTHNPVVFLVLNCIAGAGLGMFNLVVYALVTDVIDDIQVQTGVREDATCYSVYSFCRKVGQALAGSLSGAALTFVGYQAGATAVQTQATVDGIYNLAVLVPGVFMIAMLFIFLFLYPLDKKRVNNNAAMLKANAENAAAATK